MIIAEGGTGCGTGIVNGVELLLGDVLEVVRDLPDDSFTACFCDPPYGLGFMSKEWDHGVPNKEIWAGVLRVLKPGAVLMAFGGTRTWHRLAVAIEDAGFELFDTMMWLYGRGFPKSLNVSKAMDEVKGAKRLTTRRYVRPDGSGFRSAVKSGTSVFGVGGDQPITLPVTDIAKIWEGYGTALKPAWEPILLARKPRCATYVQTAMEHRTGTLNIDGCRIGTARDKQGGGGQGRIFGKGHPAPVNRETGRWPTNLLLSHLFECNEGRCVNSCSVATLGRVARYFYCTKASKKERDAGLKKMRPMSGGEAAGRRNGSADTKNPRAGAGRTGGMRNLHPTIKPLALCEYLARLIVPPLEYRDKAQLFVPFCGTGSEIIGALMAGWRNIAGIDIMSEYLEIAKLRIAAYKKKPKQLKLIAAIHTQKPKQSKLVL